MAILEPKQVAHSDFSAGLRAFESGANMITAALDKAAKMPSAWQTQMRNYNENEAMQRLGQAKNMEEMYEAFRSAMGAGDTAYNNGFENKLLINLDTQTRLNNQAATERAERDLGKYYTEIANAQARGDVNAEIAARNRFEEERARLELKTGLDYNPLKFKDYDYQANARGWAAHNLDKARLKFDMHDGIAKEQARIALNQAKSNPNYNQEDPVAETNALYFAFEHAAKSGNIAAVNLIMDEINKSPTFDRNSSQAQEIYNRYSSLAAGAGQYDPSAINVDPYTSKLGLQAKLGDKYATGVDAAGNLTAASYAPDAAFNQAATATTLPTTANTTAGHTAAPVSSGSNAFSTAVEEANKQQTQIAQQPQPQPQQQQQQPQTQASQTAFTNAQQQAMKAADEAMQQFTAKQEEKAAVANTPTTSSVAQASKPLTRYEQEVKKNRHLAPNVKASYNLVLNNSQNTEMQKEGLSNFFVSLSGMANSESYRNIPGVETSNELLDYLAQHEKTLDFTNKDAIAQALIDGGLVAPEYTAVNPGFGGVGQYAANPSASTSSTMVQQPITLTAQKRADEIYKIYEAAQEVETKTQEDNLLLDQTTSAIIDNDNFKLEIPNGFNNEIVEGNNAKQMAGISSQLSIASSQYKRAEEANNLAIDASPQMTAIDQAKNDVELVKNLSTKSFEEIICDKILYSFANARDPDDTLYKDKGELHNRGALIEKIRKDKYFPSIIEALEKSGADDITQKVMLDNYAAKLVNRVGDNWVMNDITFNSGNVHEFNSVICNKKNFDKSQKEYESIQKDNIGIQSKMSKLTKTEEAYQNIYSPGSYSGRLITGVANKLSPEEFMKLRSAAANGDAATLEKLMWQHCRDVGTEEGKQPLNDRAFELMVKVACRDFVTINSLGDSVITDLNELKQINYKTNQRTIFSGIR